ncbi:MAG: enoyl-CoA hydratase-related protein [Candidatus Hydrogenedentota bacterium]
MTTLSEFKALLVHREESRLYITINRPEVKNAINADVTRELSAVADSVEDDPTIRTVIVRGSEGTFCAGGDIKGFKQSYESSPVEDGSEDPIAKGNRSFGDFLIQFNTLPATTVGVIEGAAFGGGLGLTCVFDVTICMADTKFALSETGLGVVPAQIAPFVVQRLGLTTARRIALTGARFDGNHAFEIGLVHFLVNTAEELDDTLKKVLNGIGRCAPRANAATKKILMDTVSRPIDEVLDDGSRAFAAQLRGPEGREGVQAFLDKRKAAWVETVE